MIRKTIDLDRDIVTIRYNILNLPDVIQFKNGNQIKNLYDASGQKLGAEYFTWRPGANVPVVNIGDALSISYAAGSVDQNGTAYIGNVEYNTQNGNSLLTALNRIHNIEGYVENISSPNYYYYRKDHLGNNREVWLANTSATKQWTQYYPSGLPWVTTLNDNQSTQPYKYNGKEFVEMHGYDTYDYGARGYYPAIGRFTSVDPLAERHYNVSPYVYCGNNPVSFIDSNGMDSTYYNSQGNTIYKCGDDPNTNATFVVKTTETTDQMYKVSNPDQKGNSNPISTQDAITAENEIKDGNVTGDHMKNVAKMESQTQMESMVASIKDDGSHGAGANNNKEYSGDFTTNGVGNLKTSLVGDPSKGKNLVTQGDPNFHSHPSGNVRLTGATALWQQAPSKQDISTASRKRYEYTPVLPDMSLRPSGYTLH